MNKRWRFSLFLSLLLGLQQQLQLLHVDSQVLLFTSASSMFNLTLHRMPDPCPMIRNGELQDLKGCLKEKTWVEWCEMGQATDTAASGCALSPSRSSGSYFWGCGWFPEILWGMSEWQLFWTGRNRAIVDSWQALAASRALPAAPDKEML